MDLTRSIGDGHWRRRPQQHERHERHCSRPFMLPLMTFRVKASLQTYRDAHWFMECDEDNAVGRMRQRLMPVGSFQAFSVSTDADFNEVISVFHERFGLYRKNCAVLRLFSCIVFFPLITRLYACKTVFGHITWCSKISVPCYALKS